MFITGDIDEYMEKLENALNQLKNNVFLRNDYHQYSNDKEKCLIVEGLTDENFFKRIKANSTYCVVAKNIIKSNNIFYEKEKEDRFSSKKFIKDVIKEIFIRKDSPFTEWDLYGLIDSDGESSSDLQRYKNLFVTTTHDLETLLLSTDEYLLSNIPNCDVVPDEINKAYFVSHQLSTLRNSLRELFNQNQLDIKWINGGSYQVQFSKFVEPDSKINAQKVIKYIVSESINENGKKANNTKKIIDKFLNSKAGNKFDKDGIWKKGIESFEIDDNFWFVANGHDILQLLRYYNLDFGCIFNNKDNKDLYREFEDAIIVNYDLTKFIGTKLWEDMKNAELLSN